VRVAETMADLHIDDFYKDAALILLRLYGVFPRKHLLFVDEICGFEEADEFGLPSARSAGCFSAMIWLGEQGYLQYEAAIRQEALDQAVLTEKSFLLLSSRSELPVLDAEPQLPPSVMAESLTNVAQLRRAVGSNSSILIEQCVHYLLSSAQRFNHN
jgi:hypothetical protein